MSDVYHDMPLFLCQLNFDVSKSKFLYFLTYIFLFVY